MKISAKVLLALTLLGSVALVAYAQEDADEEAEVEVEDDVESDEAEIEEEPVDEVKAAEDATGIVDPSNYPGRVISRKKISSKNPAVGFPLEFEYTIWNVGNSDVVDVELVDEFNAEDFTEAKKVNIKVDKIAAGAKHVETHTVVPTREDKIKLQGAKVTYKSVTSADDDTLVQYASDGASEGIVPIASAAFYKRHVASHLFDWLCFAVLAIPSTLLPYMAAQNTITRYGKAKTA